MKQYAALDDTVYFWFASNDTSGSGGDGASAAADVRLAGAAADAAPVYSPTPALLSHVNYPAGSYEIAITASAANGFATGNTYAVFCTLAIDSQNPTGFVGSFDLKPVESDVTKWLGTAAATPTVAGVPEVDITHLLGTAWLAPGVAGTPDVNAKLLGGTSQTGRDIGASVLLSTGTGAGQLDFTSGIVKSNLTQILAHLLTQTGTQLADGFEHFFDVATPTGTVDSLPAAAPNAAGGIPISAAGGLDLDTKLANTNEITAARMGALTDWLNGERLDAILDIIAADTTTDIPALIATAQSDLDKLTGADGATLATAQGNYAPNVVVPDAAGVAATPAEVATALTDINLDHLMKIAVNTDWATTVHLDSVIGHMADVGTAATFDRTTDALEALRSRGDAEWITATGFNTTTPPTVTQIREEMDTNSTKMAPSQTLADYKATGYSVPNEYDTVIAALQTDLDNPNQYKATGFNTTTPPTVGEIRTEMEGVGTKITGIKDKTDNIPASPAPSGEYDTEMARIDVDVSSRNATTPPTVAAIRTEMEGAGTKLTLTLEDTAQIGAAGAGLTDLGGMSAGMKTEVNDQVVDVIKTDTTAEMSQGAPPATPTFEEMIAYIYFKLRNKGLTTATEDAMYDDAGTTKLMKATLSDNGTTFEKSEYVSGA